MRRDNHGTNGVSHGASSNSSVIQYRIALPPPTS